MLRWSSAAAGVALENTFSANKGEGFLSASQIYISLRVHFLSTEMKDQTVTHFLQVHHILEDGTVNSAEGGHVRVLVQKQENI